MKTFTPLLSLLSLVVYGFQDSVDSTVTVTVTRTFTACPVRTVDACDNSQWSTWEATNETSLMVSETWMTSVESTTKTTSSSSWSDSVVFSASSGRSVGSSSTISILHPTSVSTTSGATTSATSSADSISPQSLTTVISIILAPTITSTTSLNPTTTLSLAAPATSSVTGTISNPGTSFVPSAQIPNAHLAKRSTVYIDLSNPNGISLTTDTNKAGSFSITSDGVLETTLRSYPYICGTAFLNNQPGRFYCDDSGAIPMTYKGWINNPTFTYKNWSFCYKSDMSLFLAPPGGLTSDCTALTFVAGAGIVPSGSD